MRIDLLTREYPPEVYGGAGVHVAELTRALRRRADVRVRCMGGSREEDGTTAYPLGAEPGAQRFVAADLRMAADCAGADVVHSHTWYANAAGHAARLAYGLPHVVTLHSLEPLRPWKAEQLGGGYALSCRLERTAVLAADALIAVSDAMREDVLRVYPEVPPERVHVIHNGIDTTAFRPEPVAADVRRYGIDPERPVVLFVGRITRQKGLPHLLRAAFRLRPDAQLVLCCGQPDTPEIAAETDGLVAELRAGRGGVVRVDGMLDRRTLRRLLSLASVFVCPSVYEPMGIVNLEAMACGTAVVAAETGGIPEVVADGRTGLLVPVGPRRPDGSGEPAEPEAFAARLAAAVNRLLDDPALAARFGGAGRALAVGAFSWDRVADRTLEVYRRAARLHPVGSPGGRRLPSRV